MDKESNSLSTQDSPDSWTIPKHEIAYVKGLVSGLPSGDRALRLALDLAEHPDRPGGTRASMEDMKVLLAKIRLTSSPGNWAERRIAVWLLGRVCSTACLASRFTSGLRSRAAA